ncbi:hypothetical protein NW739_06580 [Mycoplasmopsis felis]|nr:hypothetical protein [Mycoplasmopsis felis]MCU9934708.1 hypothetical protein [Mycoplasmopsis felis]MCU9940307.1 hypothetical protein [Mycoplasmopsis felis]UWV79387.1 hypothetical protein NW072_05055 [Mycoplasmopsis felis]UWV85451.1 hypothetical protein NW066_01935 [Mycoplasmopsis felis]WAM00611.1 hypothetical protein NWE60_03850 [Mycoplasmopsis felis]
MENKSELLTKFKDLLDEISSKQLNKDQKELAYEILSKPAFLSWRPNF